MDLEGKSEQLCSVCFVRNLVVLQDTAVTGKGKVENIILHHVERQCLALNSTSNCFQVEKVLSPITVNEAEVCDSIGNDASGKSG